MYTHVNLKVGFEGSNLHGRVSMMGCSELSCIKQNLLFAYAKTKAQISCADHQRLCFRYIDSTIPLEVLPKSKISSFSPSSEAVQLSFRRTWSEIPKTGFLMMRFTLLKS